MQTVPPSKFIRRTKLSFSVSESSATMASPPPLTTTTTTTRTSDERDKTVMGFPLQRSGIAAGYPLPVPPPTSYPIGAASPYVAPAPTGYSNTYPYSNPPHNPRRSSTFLYRVICALIAVIFLLAVIFFIEWLILRPRLPEFGVKSATLAPLNATDSGLSATWDISFLVKNPNEKLDIFYDRVEVWLAYGDEFLLSGVQLPTFSQDKRNETVLRSKLAVASQSVDGELLREISKEKASGSLSFDIRVSGLIRFKKGAWRTRRHLMRVSCEDVTFKFSSPKDESGSLVGGPRACKVAL